MKHDVNRDVCYMHDSAPRYGLLSRAMSCNPRRMMATSRTCAALLAEEVVMTAETESGPVPTRVAHGVHSPVALGLN